MLYFFKKLYSVIERYQFEPNSPFKYALSKNVLCYLSACALDKYPYHIDNGQYQEFVFKMI